MLPAEDSLPVALVEGWPVPNPESAVVLRESGITLGEIMLNDEEWPTLRSSPVYSVRIDGRCAESLGLGLVNPWGGWAAAAVE